MPKFSNEIKRTIQISQDAAENHFDFNTTEQILEKIEEELAEVRQALAENTHDAIVEELGDLLFSTLNLFRFLNIDTESTLQKSNDKFENRYKLMLKLIADDNETTQTLSFDQLDLYWQKAKRLIDTP